MKLDRKPVTRATWGRKLARRGLLVGVLSVAVVDLAACGNSAAGASQPAAVATAPAGSSTGLQTGTKLNLNTATREQFLTIPGVGDRMVREFEEYRPYASIQQFRREIGKYV